MRILPPDLLAKLNQNLQVPSTDAEPHLRAVVTQATANTLLSEIIHEDATPAYGDVAIRQVAGEASPSLAYAVCIDEGKATVYERLLPAQIDHKWTKLFELGRATDAAMEFIGTWTIDSDGQCYFLQTEETPLVFLVIGGVLYAQQWNDESTRYQLATGVVHVSAVRAWKSSDEPLLDQGLIVAYTKTDGSVHYRALAELTLGELSWDLEQDVPQLATGNVSVQVFRTNDFRFGILCERGAGGFQYVLSKRTYAGQSVKPEAVYAQVRDISLSVKQITRTTAEDGAHYLDAEVPQLTGYVGYYKTKPGITITPTQRVSDHEFLVTANRQLQEQLPLKPYVTIWINAVITTMPVIVNAEVNGNTILVTTDIDISPRQEVRLTFYDAASLRYVQPETSYLLVDTFTVIFEPEAGWDDHPTLNALVELDSFDYTHVDNWVGGYAENETLTATVGGVSLVMTMVGPVPV